MSKCDIYSLCRNQQNMWFSTLSKFPVLCYALYDKTYRTTTLESSSNSRNTKGMQCHEFTYGNNLSHCIIPIAKFQNIVRNTELKHRALKEFLIGCFITRQSNDLYHFALKLQIACYANKIGCSEPTLYQLVSLNMTCISTLSAFASLVGRVFSIFIEKE